MPALALPVVPNLFVETEEQEHVFAYTHLAGTQSKEASSASCVKVAGHARPGQVGVDAAIMLRRWCPKVGMQ